MTMTGASFVRLGLSILPFTSNTHISDSNDSSNGYRASIVVTCDEFTATNSIAAANRTLYHHLYDTRTAYTSDPTYWPEKRASWQRFEARLLKLNQLNDHNNCDRAALDDKKYLRSKLLAKDIHIVNADADADGSSGYFFLYLKEETDDHYCTGSESRGRNLKDEVCWEWLYFLHDVQSNDCKWILVDGRQSVNESQPMFGWSEPHYVWPLIASEFEQIQEISSPATAIASKL